MEPGSEPFGGFHPDLGGLGSLGSLGSVGAFGGAKAGDEPPVRDPASGAEGLLPDDDDGPAEESDLDAEGLELARKPPSTRRSRRSRSRKQQRRRIRCQRFGPRESTSQLTRTLGPRRAS